MGVFSFSQFSDPGRFQYLGGTKMPVIFSRFQQNTPVSIANTAVETTAITTGVGSVTYPANWFNVDSIARIKIYGGVQTLDASETIDLKVYLNAIKIYDSGAIALPSIATSTAFKRELDFSFSAIGASGSLSVGTTELIYTSPITSYGDSNSPTVDGIDTTIPETLNITYTWGAASASNSLVIYGIVVESLG